jgi:hypothetical protein
LHIGLSETVIATSAKPADGDGDFVQRPSGSVGHKSGRSSGAFRMQNKVSGTRIPDAPFGDHSGPGATASASNGGNAGDTSMYARAEHNLRKQAIAAMREATAASKAAYPGRQSH